MRWLDVLLSLQAALDTATLGCNCNVSLGGWASVPNTDNLYIQWVDRKPVQQPAPHETLTLNIDLFIRPDSLPGNLDSTAAMLAAYTKLDSIQAGTESAISQWLLSLQTKVTSAKLAGWSSDVGAFYPTHGSRLVLHLVYPIQPLHQQLT